MSKARVLFTSELTPEALIRIYDELGVKLEGKVAVKLHSGEVGNQNFLRPSFVEGIIKHVNGTIVECNTAYPGKRNTTKAHWETMKEHGWTAIAPVDILDEEGEMELEVHNGKHLSVNYVGEHLKNYDSMLMLSHFKGHPMGGFGGALKNMSIGLASSHGKAHIHGVGKPDKMWEADQVSFLESMADADESVMAYMNNKIVYINVMVNMSVDCDCCAKAEDPMIKDIGILASLDPVALDQACVDLVYNAEDEGKSHLIERIESRKGLTILEAASALGIGSREYELVNI